MWNVKGGGLGCQRAIDRFVAADVGVSVHGIVPPLSRVVPMQFAGFFGRRDLVRTVAERQSARESATADRFGFASDGNRIGTVAMPLYQSCHDRFLTLLQ
jgi:hypothetical protein